MAAFSLFFGPNEVISLFLSELNRNQIEESFAIGKGTLANNYKFWGV